MIYQINPLKTKTQPLPPLHPEPVPVRQLHLSRSEITAEDNPFLDIFTAGPYLVPVTRRVE